MSNRAGPDRKESRTWKSWFILVYPLTVGYMIRDEWLRFVGSPLMVAYPNIHQFYHSRLRFLLDYKHDSILVLMISILYIILHLLKTCHDPKILIRPHMVKPPIGAKAWPYKWEIYQVLGSSHGPSRGKIYPVCHLSYPPVICYTLLLKMAQSK